MADPNKSLSNFRTQFMGGARPTLFRVTAQFPPGVDSGQLTSKMSFDCKGAQLPGTTVNPILVPFQGRNVKIAGDRDFQPITLTVINDSDWQLRTAFERWMNLMNGHAENVGATLPKQYQTDFWIEQLDRTGLVIAKYVLVDAFPIDVSAIDLSYESVDTIEEFSVTLEMQYWKRPEAGIE